MFWILIRTACVSTKIKKKKKKKKKPTSHHTTAANNFIFNAELVIIQL